MHRKQRKKVKFEEKIVHNRKKVAILCDIAVMGHGYYNQPQMPQMGQPQMVSHKSKPLTEAVGIICLRTPPFRQRW